VDSKLPQADVELHKAPKVYSIELDKARPPKQTVEWVRKRFDSLGHKVLDKTLRIDTGRLDVPVFISLYTPEAVKLTGTAKQMGKGASPEQAEASALMELAERYSFWSFVRQGQLPVFTPHNAPQPVMDFSQAAKAVHHPQDDLSRAKAVYDLLPQAWVRAHNLNLGRDESLPLDWFFTINEYNGPAAGNCLEEAVLQSLCELVERHISAVVTNDKRPTPAIDPGQRQGPGGP
jgi:ribosomal protein S12 methylthiotransferase accessory factor